MQAKEVTQAAATTNSKDDSDCMTAHNSPQEHQQQQE
jgi:hypothetical protein